jgi:hypothetical protein
VDPPLSCFHLWSSDKSRKKRSPQHHGVFVSSFVNQERRKQKEEVEEKDILIHFAGGGG